MSGNSQGHLLVRDGLPEDFPTHAHPPEFWEQLGRAVATFGFLEDTLARAIFALTGTHRYDSEEECEAAFEKWISELEQLLSDNLRPLIDKYERAARNYPGFTTENIDKLVSDLRKAAEVRNVLGHASWDHPPDENGRTVPRAFHRTKGQFATPVDVEFFKRVRKSTVELACGVRDTITHMGWQFPGTDGPGKPIWKREA